MGFPTDLEYHIWTDHSLMGQTLSCWAGFAPAREKCLPMAHAKLRIASAGLAPASTAASLAAPPARLSTFVSLSRYEAQSLLVFPSSGSAHAAPPFPRSGPGGPGSPLSSVLCGRYDPLTCVPSAYLFANRYRGALPGVCAFARALPPSGQRRTVGRGLLFSAGIPFPAVCLPRTRQGLPSSLASHPAALRRSSDPGRPLAPRP